MEKLISREVCMAYPDFSKPFDTDTDASKRQLGAAITQNIRPIAFNSKKLNTAQQNYAITDLELLSVVMALREFRNILLGTNINMCTDHKNVESDFSIITNYYPNPGPNHKKCAKCGLQKPNLIHKAVICPKRRWISALGLGL